MKLLIIYSYVLFGAIQIQKFAAAEGLINCLDRARDKGKISPSAKCGRRVEFGSDPLIGPNVIIIGGTFGDHFEAGSDSMLGDAIVAGNRVKIGQEVCVESSVTFEDEVEIPIGVAVRRRMQGGYRLYKPHEGNRYMLVNNLCRQVDRISSTLRSSMRAPESTGSTVQNKGNPYSILRPMREMISAGLSSLRNMFIPPKPDVTYVQKNGEYVALKEEEPVAAVKKCGETFENGGAGSVKCQEAATIEGRNVIHGKLNTESEARMRPGFVNSAQVHLGSGARMGTKNTVNAQLRLDSGAVKKCGETFENGGAGSVECAEGAIIEGRNAIHGSLVLESKARMRAGNVIYGKVHLGSQAIMGAENVIHGQLHLETEASMGDDNDVALNTTVKIGEKSKLNGINHFTGDVSVGKNVSIAEYSNLHNAKIADHVKIGKNAIVCGSIGVEAELGDDVHIAVDTIIHPGIVVGNGSCVGARVTVSENILERMIFNEGDDPKQISSPNKIAALDQNDKCVERRRGPRVDHHERM